MALTPQSNEAFLREVDDELRRDQMLSIWQRYGRWIVAGVVAALIAFAGVLYWQHRSMAAAGTEGETLQAAFDDLGSGNSSAATPVLAQLAQSKRDGYRAAALFTQADVLLQKNDNKGAAAKFAAVAQDTSLAQPYRDLALVRQTTAEYETLKPDVVIQRLAGLAQPGSAWHGSAGELVAVAYMQQGKNDAAARVFAAMARDKDVPRSLRQRAVQMAAVLGVDVGDVMKELTAR